jgi:hypothetical protein
MSFTSPISITGWHLSEMIALTPGQGDGDLQAPPRPASCHFDSISQLYGEFARIFLSTAKIESATGQFISVFDHHFFHMAGIEVDGQSRLLMRDEKTVILSTTEGFGKFRVLYGGSRAKGLASAYETLARPDEVWEGNPKCVNARWVYIKRFDSLPYPYTIALVTSREKLLVPVSSFACKNRDIKKWRRGVRLY